MYQTNPWTEPRHASRTRVELGSIVHDPADAATGEVHVGWASDPVAVSLRQAHGRAQDWNAVRAALEQRVLGALEPLLRTGWTLGSSFASSVRWETFSGTGADLYEGCWVRLRRAGE